MQPLGIETISGTPGHLTILNSFLFSFTLLTPWQIAQKICILFHSTTNLHYFQGYFLVASFVFQPRACNRKTSLF